jgi:RNA polymerase sigma factor (sigma-70 family)
MPELNDPQLLAEFIRHDSEEAFATLVSRHVNLVYSTALRRTGNPHHAEEITQAVFILLARKAGKLSPRVVLSGWLYQAARFTSANFLKGEIRRQMREQEAFMHSISTEPDDLTWKQIAPLLDEAMGSLGEIDRDTVVLRFFENKTAAEAAATLKLSEAAAHKRLNRALEKLRTFFKKRGVVSTTAILAGVMSAHSVHAAPAVLAKSATAAALAKGTGVGGSALVLAQGASKLMAWVKVKTAALATAAVIAGFGTTALVIETFHAIRAAHYPDIQGAWQGVMLRDEDGVGAGEASRTRVVLKLTKTSDGYKATTDWIDMGRSNVVLGKVTYNYPSLQIEAFPRDTWHLKINEDATRMMLDHAIHIIQPAPLMLTRTVTPDAVPPRLTEAQFAPRAGFDLQGYWKGEIGPDNLPVALKIAELPDGTFLAEGDSPMQGANGLPVTVIYNPPTVNLLLATGAGKFEGTLDNSHTAITGRFTQGGQSVPAALRRSDYRADQRRDAGKDYSFTSANDLQGHWAGIWEAVFPTVKVKMNSTLHIAKLPDGQYTASVAGDLFGHDDPIPASEFHYDPPTVRIKWKWAAVGYEGKLQDGKLVGTWQQGGGGFALVYKRQLNTSNTTR